MRYRYLTQHRDGLAPLSVRKACRIFKVAPSGFYEFQHRRKSNRQIEREALEGFVADIFTANKARYGYRRINRELRKTGIVVSEKRVLKVMQSKGLQAKGTTRRWRRAKAVEPGDPRINLVQRVFTVAKRNTLWVGDITYVPTGEGWLYLAAVIDAWSRKVVGWSMSHRITEDLAIDAIEQAVGRENPDKGLVFHDDQGVQYTSHAFQQCLERHGITQSVSRPGNPYDNAVSESFFKTLKRELVNGRNYQTRQEAQQDIFKYIELYYNPTRIHSTLGYMSPLEYEQMAA